MTLWNKKGKKHSQLKKINLSFIWGKGSTEFHITMSVAELGKDASSAHGTCGAFGHFFKIEDVLVQKSRTFVDLCGDFD